MKIKMDYGREGLEIDVPDYSDILIPNHKNEINNPETVSYTHLTLPTKRIV